MTTPEEVQELARLFIKALNARDAEALVQLATEDAEWRRPDGEVMRGAVGLRALIGDAQRRNLGLVPLGVGTVKQKDGGVLFRLPVREAAGDIERDRVAEFEFRDGRVAAFQIRPVPPAVDTAS
jgi:ketosteroid isomerase-like protein